MTQNRYYSSTAASVTLSSGCTSTDTTINVSSTTGYPVSFPYCIVVDPGTANMELMDVTSASATTLTVTRGVDGTSAKAHSTGATVEHYASARDFTEAGQHVGGTAGVHGVTGSVVGTTDAQTLANKTIDGGSNTLSNIAQSSVTGLTTALVGKESTANKGVANGYASLDGTTKVPFAQLPTGTTSTTVAIGDHTHTGPTSVSVNYAAGPGAGALATGTTTLATVTLSVVGAAAQAILYLSVQNASGATLSLKRDGVTIKDLTTSSNWNTYISIGDSVSPGSHTYTLVASVSTSCTLNAGTYLTVIG